jgi:hypothetical protein
MSPHLPSEAQARRLAALFAHDAEVRVSDGYTAPTDRVLVKRAWVSDSGQSGIYPNGHRYSIWKITACGLAALESYLRRRRQASSAR